MSALAPRHWRWWLLGAVLLLVAVAAVLLLRAPAPGGTGGAPLPVVAAAPVQVVEWRSRLRATGTLQAVQGVEVTTDTPGIVSAIHFDSGDRVEAGARLVALEAEAASAQVQSIEAQLSQARADLGRSRRLLRRGAVAEAEAEQAATAVRRLEAELRAQQARLSDTRILAPFAGELGLRRVDLGQFLAAGQAVTTLQQIAPIHLDFSLPEGNLPLLSVGLPVEVTVQAWPDRVFEGRLAAISPAVEAATRSLRLQAILPNDARLLRPGMFAAATVLLTDRRRVVALPVSAVTYNPYGDAVFVVQPPAAADQPDPAGSEPPGWLAQAGAALRGLFAGGEEAPPEREEQPEGEEAAVRRSFVALGERRGGLVEVLRGVGAEDRVVTAGQIKISDGQRVRIAAEAAVDQPPAEAAVSRASR
ncbi:efflux RND transporter periplasmic adaptor subunit [Falsiroseomonas selenitidurans]|uniref:Efflux RND transporter periplasmic adaptor subunit n=1 Tax=Falsiroseomonas selenitidurans TaxID=2716335 RepID=A0ABX1DXZ1_9PROT|nr:efflux RND transporter periplasmic adaptor subunit [Falsiroseomonas selenitidurans]NKC29739.1 efflux RND transporter periplasmic adaptor subunit [Falsiroseomonas selenitidurans]